MNNIMKDNRHKNNTGNITRLKCQKIGLKFKMCLSLLDKNLIYFNGTFFLKSFQIPKHRRETGGGDRTCEERHGVRIQCLSQHERYSSERARSSGRLTDRHEGPRLRSSLNMLADQVLPGG